MADVKNGNTAINAKTTEAKLMRFSPVMEYKVSLKKCKVSIPEAPWVVFYTPERIIYRLNVISRTKRAMYSQLCPAK